MKIHWPWQRKKGNWEIQPQDIHLNPFSQNIDFVVKEGWEPFGVSAVPNTLDSNQVRIWMRRRELAPNNKEYEIELASAGWGGHEVILHLSAQWEPFGLSISPPDQPVVWFRRAA